MTFFCGWTQSENRLIRRGNGEFEEGNFDQAAVEYIKSLEKNEDTYKGKFNLGTTYYMRNTYDAAAKAFDTVRNYNLDDETMASTYYNLGNSLLKMAQDTSIKSQDALPGSIEAYKRSLRLNPDDMDAKYNLAYAKKLMQQQQNQDQGQDQNQDQNQDQQEQNQDQQQQNQDQQEQQQEQEQEQNQQEQQQQQQQQQRQPQEISKEDAERMLQALKNDEKETLEKLKKAKVKVTTTKSEKDW
jgi:hypothetical protein